MAVFFHMTMVSCFTISIRNLFCLFKESKSIGSRKNNVWSWWEFIKCEVDESLWQVVTRTGSSSITGNIYNLFSLPMQCKRNFWFLLERFNWRKKIVAHRSKWICVIRTMCYSKKVSLFVHHFDGTRFDCIVKCEILNWSNNFRCNAVSLPYILRSDLGRA